ncbi:hypothetical protein AB0E81_08005 [Streptomyces sp. NPDC033538]|uniref:hypothetical protein n=1 Tax=Streptomyces sp. NPDC033538 TaxID=3155367 RepID=UPI00340FD146
MGAAWSHAPTRSDPPPAPHLHADSFDLVVDIEPSLPRFRLDEGDILVLDNFRRWHGRDGHAGERTVRVLTARGSDAG